MEMFQELSFIYVSALMKPQFFMPAIDYYCKVSWFCLFIKVSWKLDLANNEVYALKKISVLLSLSPNLEI